MVVATFTRTWRKLQNPRSGERGYDLLHRSDESSQQLRNFSQQPVEKGVSGGRGSRTVTRNKRDTDQQRLGRSLPLPFSTGCQATGCWSSRSKSGQCLAIHAAAACRLWNWRGDRGRFSGSVASPGTSLECDTSPHCHLPLLAEPPSPFVFLSPRSFTLSRSMPTTQGKQGGSAASQGGTEIPHSKVMAGSFRSAVLMLVRSAMRE